MTNSSTNTILSAIAGWILLTISLISGVNAQTAYENMYYTGRAPAMLLSEDAQTQVEASIARSDTFDILKYDIDLDVTAFNERTIRGVCEVTFQARMDVDHPFSLDLLDLTIDSILYEAAPIDFTRDGFRVNMNIPEPMVDGEVYSVTVIYHGTPTVSTGNFGGFYFEGPYAYNLGIDLIGMPHNFGRSWFPCFDNFVERATYDTHITTSGGRLGYGSGRLVEETIIQGDTIRRSYRLDDPIPTYLLGVAISDYVEYNEIHQGAYGEVPIQIIARPDDLDDAVQSLALLPDAIDCLEFWYGPYTWDRVGFVMTARGAMEHATSIAYPIFSVNNGQPSTRLMTHELAHHWWGNTTVMRTAQDMWIKEGNGEYGAHLIQEFIGGDEGLRTTVRDNHRFVLLNAHVDDGGYIALSPLSQENTYGTHTYQKGASVIHNLRAYLGDSLFRAGQQTILEDFRFDHMDALTYRDALTAATGVDMTAFFEDWIFSGGYTDHHIHHFFEVAEDNTFAVVMDQSRFQSDRYHEDVPMPISIFFEDGSRVDTRLLIPNRMDTVMLDPAMVASWPSAPTSIGVNIGHIMNLAMFEHSHMVTEAGNYSDVNTNHELIVQSLTDTFNYAIELHLTAPTGQYDSAMYQLSSNHFWHSSGFTEGGFTGSIRLEYNDADLLAPTDDLTGDTEDDLVLLHRPDARSPWTEHPDYQVIKLIPTDGRGLVDIRSEHRGDFALANRRMVSSVNRPTVEVEVNIFPNPSSGRVQITSPSTLHLLEVYDPSGMTIGQYLLHGASTMELDLSGHPSGVYYLVAHPEDRNLHSVSLSVMKSR